MHDGQRRRGKGRFDGRSGAGRRGRHALCRLRIRRHRQRHARQCAARVLRGISFPALKEFTEASTMNLPKKLLTAIAFAAAMACAAPGQQAPAQQPLPHDGFPAGPTARILSFTASPDSIQPGQSVTLEWAVVNADRIALDQGIGIVATRDTRMVTPRVTTTYTLAALGFGGKVNETRSVTVTIAGTTPSPAGSAAANEPLANKPVPRMPAGKP